MDPPPFTRDQNLPRSSLPPSPPRENYFKKHLEFLTSTISRIFLDLERMKIYPHHLASLSLPPRSMKLTQGIEGWKYRFFPYKVTFTRNLSPTTELNGDGRGGEEKKSEYHPGKVSSDLRLFYLQSNLTARDYDQFFVVSSLETLLLPPQQ